MDENYTFTIKNDGGNFFPLTFTAPSYSTGANSTINQEKKVVNSSSNGGFSARNKPDKKFRAEKVTKSNVRELALQAGRKVGGEVISDDEFFVVSRSRFDVGDWVVEGYDYERGVPTYRKATLAEREEYDLR